MLFRQLTIRARLYLAIALLTFSLAALGGWGVYSNQVATQHVASLFDQSNKAADRLAKLRESLGNMRRLEANAIAIGSSNTIEVERMAGLWKAEIAAARAASMQLAEVDPSNLDLGKLAKGLDQQLAEYADIIGPIIEKMQRALIDGSAALAYAQQAEEKSTALGKTADAFRKEIQESQVSLRDEMASSSSVAAMARLVFVGLTLAVLLPLMWLTLRSVCGPVERAVVVAGRIAEGDLSETLVIEGNDETADLLRSLQGMQGALRTLVGQVRESADSIQVASSEVASGNLDLSLRTEHAASNLQQTASAIEQLTGTVAHNAESARKANLLATSAAAVAQRGGDVVSRVISTMDQINGRSKKIADIIGVIDGIAFQTNILALNAAVEAARAGEQGRGFAVVASEVRSLAQRSADAAREIKALIGASVECVDSGARLVQDAGSTMTEIVSSVQLVTGIVGEISDAANAQSGGIGSVNQSVAELDRMTQQNAALVEQSAAAADSLKQQAAMLSALVSRFRLAQA
jgi:methyl-accepting chemotaxis protein